MVYFPYSLQPTQWLHYSATSIASDYRVQLQAVIAAFQDRDWRAVQNIASSIRQQRWIQQGDWLGTAIMLMGIADQCLIYDEFEIALTQYSRAQYILHLHINPIQRQNEAAALYGMGISELALRQSTSAAAHFGEAGELLATAEQYWIINSQNEHAAACNRRRRWMGEIIDAISIAVKSSPDHEIIWKEILRRKWIFEPAVGAENDAQISTQRRHMLQANAVMRLKQIQHTYRTNDPDHPLHLLLRRGGRN